MNRREFLVGGTAVTLAGGAGAFASVTVGATRARAAAREVVLEAREVRWELAPGKTVRALAYNGRVPGPEIRVREGELVRVTLKNSLVEPTTVHWHGVDVPNAMDGVPDVTQQPVAPGGTFVYEFEARPAGTRWYHTHFREHHQMDLGLVAPFIVDPTGPEPFPADRDYTLVLDDWATGSGPAVPDTNAGTAGARGSMGGMMSRMRGMRGMMRQGGTMEPNKDKPAYDTMTTNGKAYPAVEPIRLRQGERVRLRLINASAEHTHAIRLAGHRLQVTHADGNPLREPVEVDVVPIAPAERYDVLVQGNRPGAWLLYCAQPGHAAAGEQMLVLYDGHERRRAEPPSSNITGLRFWSYSLGRGRDVLPGSTREPRVFDQTLGGGMMGSDVWTINGKRYPDTEALSVQRGALARVRLRNDSMEAHPMHLHGQSFRVLAVNGERLAAPLVKDSVDVEAHMASVELEFTAHNPGNWFFHCHKPMHMEGGMIALVRITG